MSPGDWLSITCSANAPNTVAITFDDGPCPIATPAILDLLAAHGAIATFFLSGARAARHPHLVRQIAAAGHAIYSHGYDHLRAELRSAQSIQADMIRAEAALVDARPTPSPYLLRLPYGSGHGSARVHRALREWRNDIQLVHWRRTFDDAALARDCRSMESLRRRCAAAADRAMVDPRLPGAVLLLHESPIGVGLPLISQVGPVLVEALLERMIARGLTPGVIGAGGPALLGRYVRTVRV